MFSKNKLKQISNRTGIYLFKNLSDQIIYIGKALRLRDRIHSYFQNQKYYKNQILASEITNIETLEVSSEVEALILEANLIRQYLPKYNISLRDDKSFIYIIITDEEFPRVLACRKTVTNLPIKYQYGPFPSTRTVKNVLRLIRKIFPFCTQSPKAKKPCFYSHLNLCNPCPALIRQKPNDQLSNLKHEYLLNIKKIRQILEGKFTNLEVQLIMQMKDFTKIEQFEKAKFVHQQIQNIRYITKPYYRISSFLENPNFLEMEQLKSIEKLKRVLSFYLKLTKLEKIEAIDIANIIGREACGSLVTFINGQKQLAFYKRFKIKSKGPNDVLMIKEVLSRRLKHQEWQYPDLFLIDGGKPQITGAVEILKTYKIPVIGLAKKEEKVIIPTKNNFLSINLKRNSPELRLLQEIRDEAHRFAQKYHHYLRKKLLFQNN